MTQNHPSAPPVSSLRLLAMLIGTFLVYALILFLPAGTLLWPAAWMYMLVYFAYTIPVVWWLKKNNPELLRKRLMVGKKEMKSWDKAIVVAITPPFIAIFVVSALDAIRFESSHLPPIIQVSGFIGLILAFGLFFRVMIENAYASRIVEVQKDHKVVSTGSYAIVRHPMYAGGIAFALFTPIALGSLWGVLPAVLIIPLLVLRAVLEEKTLLKELPGYREYTQKVKYRLLPGVW